MVNGMVPTPFILQQIRFAIREATAFVGHSFADEDEQLVEQIKQFLSKLGLKCDSGKRAEPKGISDKVRERILAAELFVGIFTRRQAQADGKFSTSAWTIEEKATALAAGKRLLLFVEEGVSEFGGLQGDYEYIPFQRNNLATALINAMDYVLSITSVPLTCRVEAPNKLHFQIGGTLSPDQQLEQLKKLVSDNPKNFEARLSLATTTANTQDRNVGITQLQQLSVEFPDRPEPHHQLGHQLQAKGDLPTALLSFQRALDLNTADYANHRMLRKVPLSTCDDYN
jgi:hypothetical protein